MTFDFDSDGPERSQALDRLVVRKEMGAAFDVGQTWRERGAAAQFNVEAGVEVTSFEERVALPDPRRHRNIFSGHFFQYRS